MSKTLIIVHDAARDEAIKAINELDYAKPHSVTIKPHKVDRSAAQNACLHGWCAHISIKVAESHGKFYPPDQWKDYLKRMFLGEETITMGKTTFTRVRSTAKLKMGEFAEFLTNIDHYSGSQLKIDLPRSDNYYTAMGRAAQPA